MLHQALGKFWLEINKKDACFRALDTEKMAKCIENSRYLCYSPFCILCEKEIS